MIIGILKENKPSESRVAMTPEVAKRFVNETTGQLYDPSAYPNHGTGLFFVAHEMDGRIHAMALDLGGSSYD